MKIRTTLALAVSALTLGVPVATADPDGYQPDLRSSAQPDAVDRYLANSPGAGEPDAIDRFLRNRSSSAVSSLGSAGASRHPDSLAVRPSVLVPAESAEAEGFSWAAGALGTVGGALIVLLAVAGASAMRERRRLVLR